jgi:hypothetical protein
MMSFSGRHYDLVNLYEILMTQMTTDMSNCAAVLADLFVYSNEASAIQCPLMKNEKNLFRFLNFTFRYIDDILALNNCKFGDFVAHIHPCEIEI